MRNPKRLSPLFLFLLFLGLVRVLPASNTETWLQIGTYSKYTSDKVPGGRVTLPNGTAIVFGSINSPTSLQWKVLSISGQMAFLEVIFRVDGKARLADEETDLTDFVYVENLSVTVDIETREAMLGERPIGKLCFWAEKKVVLLQSITIASPPSDMLEGNVSRFNNVSLAGRRMEAYTAEVFQLDPFVYAQLTFDRYTGMALSFTLMGPVEIVPGSQHTYTLENGTVYNITSYARTKLAEELGVSGTYHLLLEETNVDIGQRITSPSYEVYITMFVVLFFSLATAFIMVDRGKKRTKTKTSPLKPHR